VWFEDALDAVRIPPSNGRRRSRPKRLAGDKAYSYRAIRQWLHRRKIQPVIPQRSDQEGGRGGCRHFDRDAYRRRNVVERCISWLKECRRVATRFEKLALNFVAFLKLAIIQRCFRALSSDRP
jgi:transposase